MTQEEFDKIMTAKEERERATSGMVQVTFEHENMLLLKMDGYNYDGVSFVHCVLPEISLNKTVARYAPPHFKYCEIKGLTADEGDTSVFLWNTVVQTVHIKGDDTVFLSAQRSRINRLTLLGPNVELSLYHSSLNNELSLRDSKLDLNMSCTVIYNGLQFCNCTGTVDLGHCNIQSITFPQRNRFEAFWISHTTCMNRLNLDQWPVEYCADLMRIGCQQHSLEEWENFTDEQIDDMDFDALEWWEEWKNKLLPLVRATNSNLPKIHYQIAKTKGRLTCRSNSQRTP